VQVYWTGARYTVIPHLDLTRGLLRLSSERLRHRQGSGLPTAANSTCSAASRPFLRRHYFFNKASLTLLPGAMYSGVHGVASGYLNTTNINPTVASATGSECGAFKLAPRLCRVGCNAALIYA